YQQRGEFGLKSTIRSWSIVSQRTYVKILLCCKLTKTVGTYISRSLRASLGLNRRKSTSSSDTPLNSLDLGSFTAVAPFPSPKEKSFADRIGQSATRRDLSTDLWRNSLDSTH